MRRIFVENGLLLDVRPEGRVEKHRDRTVPPSHLIGIFILCVLAVCYKEVGIGYKTNILPAQTPVLLTIFFIIEDIIKFHISGVYNLFPVKIYLVANRTAWMMDLFLPFNCQWAKSNDLFIDLLDFDICGERGHGNRK